MSKDRKPNGYWNNYDNCRDESKKYSTRGEFNKNASKAYEVSRRNNWLKDFTWLENKREDCKPIGYWTKDICESEARKYTTSAQFAKESNGAYNASRRSGWLKDYTWLKRERILGWNKDKCFEEAKKYKTRNEFRKGASRAYELSRRNGWLDNYTWFKKK